MRSIGSMSNNILRKAELDLKIWVLRVGNAVQEAQDFVREQ